jgi:hypothetical protein
MAVKRFKAYVSEAASGARPQDSKVEGDKLEPRAKGEQDFKAKHKMTVTKHPVAGDHQFDGDRAEITEASCPSDKKKTKKENTCPECEGKGEDCECPEDDEDEESDLSEGKVVDQLQDIVKRKAAKKVKFGNGKSEELDMTTASALLNMLDKLKPANKAKAEKMLEKSPEGMFQLLDVAFGGK